MKCFYHPDRDAVNTCSKCGQPVCEECNYVTGTEPICRHCWGQRIRAGTRSVSDKGVEGAGVRGSGGEGTGGGKKTWGELTTKERAAGVGCLAVIIVVVAVVLALVCVPSEPTELVSVGDTAVLSVESEAVLLAVTEESFDELVEASVAKDYLGMAELMAIGAVFEVPNHTKVLVIDRAFGKKKVRILEGDEFGRAGWVPYEFLAREEGTGVE